MPKGSKRARRAASGGRPLDLALARGGQPTHVTVPSGREYFVTPARASTKEYLCPACGQAVFPGQRQVTAWEADSLFGDETALELRRHWHLACWRAFVAT
jgi:hypothetical protein